MVAQLSYGSVGMFVQFLCAALCARASPYLVLCSCVYLHLPVYVSTLVAYFVCIYICWPLHALCSAPDTSTLIYKSCSSCAGSSFLSSSLCFHLTAPEPQILSQPHNIWNVTGQDVIFGCEVFAYPMASIEWRKDGLDIQLPGDDPHISVQVGTGSRGIVPEKPRASPNDLADSTSGSSLGVDPRSLR